MADTPEQRARREIDAQLVAAGWLVQDSDLTARGHKGLQIRILRNCRLLYQCYPQIRQPVVAELLGEQPKLRPKFKAVTSTIA